MRQNTSPLPNMVIVCVICIQILNGEHSEECVFKIRTCLEAYNISSLTAFCRVVLRSGL